MNLHLKGRKALVTGAGRGIGLAIARTLAAEGARVALVSRTAPDLKAALSSIGGRSKGHATFALDLAAANGPKNLCSRLKSGFGTPSIVVHNAGGSFGIRDPLCSVQDWRKVFRLNMEIPVELNARLIPSMQKEGWGRIVHISSVSGSENLGPAPYCAAKAALNAYTKSFARIFAPDGIVITAVSPGAVLAANGPWDRARIERPDFVKKYLQEQTPMNRFADPEEIASMVAFLCSPKASQCSGAVVSVDGGLGRAFAP